MRQAQAQAVQHTVQLFALKHNRHLWLRIYPLQASAASYSITPASNGQYTGAAPDWPVPEYSLRSMHHTQCWHAHSKAKYPSS